jgi:hypothetical protein
MHRLARSAEDCGSDQGHPDLSRESLPSHLDRLYTAKVLGRGARWVGSFRSGRWLPTDRRGHCSLGSDTHRWPPSPMSEYIWWAWGSPVPDGKAPRRVVKYSTKSLPSNLDSGAWVIQCRLATVVSRAYLARVAEPATVVLWPAPPGRTGVRVKVATCVQDAHVLSHMTVRWVTTQG